MSQILNASPFEDKVLSLSDLQIDFILAMYAQDHPDEYKLIRGDIADVAPNIFKKWTDVLSGKTLGEFSRNPPAYLKKYFNKVL